MIYGRRTPLYVGVFFSFHFHEPISIIGRLQRSFLHAAVWLRLTWFESNEISGGSYADTPSDGLITEELRASTLRNTPAPTVPLNSRPFLPLHCVMSLNAQVTVNIDSKWAEKVQRLVNSLECIGETGLAALCVVLLERSHTVFSLYHLLHLFLVVW